MANGEGDTRAGNGQGVWAFHRELRFWTPARGGRIPATIPPLPTHLESYRPLIPALAAEGDDPRACLEALGLDPNAEAGDGADAIAEGLLAAGIARHGEGFPVRAGAFLDLGELGLYGYACLTAPDLATALTRSLRFRRLVFGDDAYALVDEGDAVALVRRAPPGPPDDPVVRGRVGLGLSEYLAALDQVAGFEGAPRQVTFAHAAPRDARAWRTRFRAPVIFGAARHALVLPRALLDRPARHGHPALASYFEAEAAAALARRPAPVTVAGRVRAQVTEALADGVPTQARVARRLGMSPRTLARRLADEGTRYREVVAQVRRSLADAWLARPEVTLAEIAWRLGFSEVSAFHRAYKRWTGRTPAEARARHR